MLQIQSKLLSRSLIVVVAMSVMSALLQSERRLLQVCVGGSLAYVVWICVRTWKLTRDPCSLGAFDTFVLRWSFLLGPIPGCSLLAGLLLIEHLGYDPEVYFFSSQAGWFVFQMLSEIGLILCFACVTMPRAAGLYVRPRWLWKVACGPFLILHIVYVAGALTLGFGESHGPQ